MSVLINDISINEFKVDRGLSQGDSLAPFLFLFVPESLSKLTQRDFDGFQVSHEVKYWIVA